MDTIDPYLLKFREMSYLSDRVFEQYLNKGQLLKIPSMTILNQSTWLQNKSYYLQEGIIREFYIAGPIFIYNLRLLFHFNPLQNLKV